MKKGDWLYLGIILLVIGILSKIFENQNLYSRHLKKLSPAVRIKFSNFLNDIKKLGYTPVIRDSIRSFNEQKRYYQQDKRNAKPGHSAHESGVAIDMDLHKNGKVLSKGTNRTAWILTGVPSLAKQHGIRWGGEFKGYPDNNHFDYLR